MQDGLRQAFKPSDHAHRARDALASCTQRGSVLGYTTAFRRCLLQCPTVTEDEALHRYVRGLRDAPRKVGANEVSCNVARSLANC